MGTIGALAALGWRCWRHRGVKSANRDSIGIYFSWGNSSDPVAHTPHLSGKRTYSVALCMHTRACFRLCCCCNSNCVVHGFGTKRQKHRACLSTTCSESQRLFDQDGTEDSAKTEKSSKKILTPAVRRGAVGVSSVPVVA